MSLTMNQQGVINNFYQCVGTYKRVITVCSAACLRSPTAAVVLSQDPFNFNTRAVGLTDEYAIVKLDDGLMLWADEIVVMEPWMRETIIDRFPEDKTPIIVLEIPDRFAYRDPELMEMIKNRYRIATGVAQ